MSRQTETLLLQGGTVRPCDGRTPVAEAVAIRDGRVAGIGTREEMRALAGSGATAVDLAGATVMPGFVDTHPHLFHFGVLMAPLVDIFDARDFDDIVARIRAKAAVTPKGGWVMTTPVGEPHYFQRSSWRDLAEGKLPDRRVLDRATTDHPVLLQAWGPTTPNICVFNSTALAVLGLDRDAPDHPSERVWIERDGSGDLTGRLRGAVNIYYTGDKWMDALLTKVPMLQPDLALEATKRAVSDYHRMGVTTIYEGHVMGVEEIGALRMLRAEDALRMRVLTSLEAEQYAMPWHAPLTIEEFRANLATAKSLTATGDDLLRHNGVTLSRGGPCMPGFLRMHEPYWGPFGEVTRGVTFVADEKEEIALRWCAENDLRLNFIGAGYRDHDDFLTRAERQHAKTPLAGRHWILQHNYLCTAEQARRYAALGFEITTSMSFSWGKGDLMGQRIGPYVWKDLIPLRRLLDAGLLVACGSDWGPKNIFEHLRFAETHEFCGSGRRNDDAAHAVSRAEAIAMWTRDAARVLQWEGIGTLAPGSHADLLVADRDPFTCPLDDLPATRVLRTLLGGETVFDAGVLRAT